MSPNLATIIQRGKRANTLRNHTGLRLRIVKSSIERQEQLLAKSASNSYFGNSLGSALYSKKGV